MHSPKQAPHASPQPRTVTTPSEFHISGNVTIGELSDNVLLEIFRYYLDVSPRHWPRLVHICRRWRCIVFASQKTLHLRIFCTHGTPVLKTLRYWPAMPIIVQYGGSLELGPPAPKDEDNIVAALTQSCHVSSISLTVTSSLLEKLSSIEEPFSELEDLALLSRDGVRLTLPSDFRWGPRLRCLHSTTIAIPGLLHILHSSRNLVDLQLHEVFDYLQFSPEALTNAFSGMARLQSLSLHFLYTDHFLAPLPQSRKRSVLPVLTHLDYRGISDYLESLVTRMDAPRLGDIKVTYFDKFVINVSKLSELIDRTEMHKSYRRAHILSSDGAISISLVQSGAPTCLELQSICEPLSHQLYSMSRICICFSALLFNVEDLRISVMRPLRQEESLDDGQWLRTINSFTGVKWFHLDWDQWTIIVRALQLPGKRYETILPSLHKLYTPQPRQRHAPLAEAVVSFMISRRLSGHPIVVEYERLCHINELHGTGPLSQQVTIQMLSDDILLNIFRCCLGPTPQIWPTLTWVCQRWRQIVFVSPLGLHLRLYCTYGTPVLKNLDYWPALPIVVNYGGFPNLDAPAPEDDDNIMAALKQSRRVSSIHLTVTSSLLGKLSAISKPFLELEELVLLSRDNTQLTLPSTFRWGLRLHTLQSTRITFPSLPQLLSHSKDLVDIQLHEIHSSGYFSPEAFANALSGMTHLRTLSLHFLSLPPRRNHLSLPPPSCERVILPSLTCLKYRGTSKYLDSLVARIDAPHLGDSDITFFSQPTMDASELGRFIERTKMQTSLIKAEVQTSAHAISISFTSSGTSTPLRLQIPCNQLDRQLSSMAQVCDQFSPFLFRIETLGIVSTRSPSGQDDVTQDVDGEQWLELVRSFGARDFHIAGVHAKDILCALCPAGGRHPTDTTVLTAVRNLRVRVPEVFDGLLIIAARLFTTSRRRSGRFVKLEFSCSICDDSFEYPEFLKSHLVDQHAYRLM